MPSVPERVANLEGTVSGQSNAIAVLREVMSRLEHRMDVRFDTVDARMDARFERVGARIDTLDDRMSRQFHWIVGIQITSLIATLAVVFSALLARS